MLNTLFLQFEPAVKQGHPFAYFNQTDIKKLIRNLFILLLALAVTNLSYGQTIQEIFKSLPLKYAPELTREAKDSLIQNGTYTFPDGDSRETMKADYSAEEDIIKLHYFFATGQNGFVNIELKKCRKNDGSTVVVYSRFGGARRAFDQHILLTFVYKEGFLKVNEDLGLPETIGSGEFLKDNLPDNIGGQTFNTSYDLDPEEPNCIAYEIHGETEQLEEWIKTHKFLYSWNGETFEKRDE